MSAKNKFWRAARGQHRVATFAVAFPCTVLCSSVIGQGLSRSPGQFETPGAQHIIDQERANLTLTPGSSLYLDPNSFLRWGPVTARPHFDAGFSYQTGLRAREGSGEDVVSESISPGVLFEIGSNWILDYTP